ncbi:MAG: DUF1573 domain-containing protein [bacterium]
MTKTENCRVRRDGSSASPNAGRRYAARYASTIAQATVAVFIIALAFASSSFAEPQPKIKFDEYEWDLGDMYQQEEKTHVFSFTNVGDAELIVKNTKTSCGCTAAIASQGGIAPGGKGEIKVTFASRTASGATSKNVSVFTNAPDSIATLVVKANIKKDIDVPNSIQFGTVTRGSKTDQVIEVSAEPGSPFQIVKVEGDAAYVTASYESVTPKAGQGASYKIRVGFTSEVPPGTVSNRLRIFTNNEKKPVLEVPIYAKVQGNLKLSTESLNFGTFAPGQAQELVLTVTAPADHPISVTAVKSSTPEVVTTLKTIQEGRTYEVHCAVSAAKTTGRVNGKLIIETSDKDEARRELTMIGFVKS